MICLAAGFLDRWCCCFGSPVPCIDMAHFKFQECSEHHVLYEIQPQNLGLVLNMFIFGSRGRGIEFQGDEFVYV